MSETARSEQACPVCLQHTLAIDEPPRIDVMGVQLYSDIVGMGDLRQEGSVGIVCLNCGTRWRDKAAFDRGEPEPEAEAKAADGPAEAFEVDDTWAEDVEEDDLGASYDEEDSDAR
jgi:hypothetical protein